MPVFPVNIKEIQNKLDQAVTKKAVSNNHATEALMRDLMDDPGYSMPKIERDVTEVYRHGFCGEACDAVLAYLQESVSPSITAFEKVNPNPEHFYLREKGSDLMIEPSYKQLIYRVLIDTDTGELKEGATEEDIAYVNHMPSLFIGTPQELENNVFDCLQHINKPHEYEAILTMWKNPAGVQPQKIEGTNVEKQAQGASLAVLYGQPEPSEGFVNRQVQSIENTVETVLNAEKEQAISTSQSPRIR